MPKRRRDHKVVIIGEQLDEIDCDAVALVLARYLRKQTEQSPSKPAERNQPAVPEERPAC